MSLKVTKYIQNRNDGNIIAFVSFYIPEWGLHLNDCRLVRTQHGGFFIGYPSREYEENSEKKYFPYFFFDKEKNERFQKAARDAIDVWVKNNSQPTLF